MNLGDEARKTIKGNNPEYYLDAMTEVREITIREIKKRDDNWLLAVDEEWPWGPTNNYCKCFHVCEHESTTTGNSSTSKLGFMETNRDKAEEILDFKNVFDLEELSGKVMGKDAIDYLNGGADDSNTVKANVEAYQKI